MRQPALQVDIEALLVDVEAHLVDVEALLVDVRDPDLSPGFPRQSSPRGLEGSKRRCLQGPGQMRGPLT